MTARGRHVTKGLVLLETGLTILLRLGVLLLKQLHRTSISDSCSVSMVEQAKNSTTPPSCPNTDETRVLSQPQNN